MVVLRPAPSGWIEMIAAHLSRFTIDHAEKMSWCAGQKAAIVAVMFLPGVQV
jgi:hypothetical protein